MKKIYLFLALVGVIFFSFTLTSCDQNSSGPGVSKLITADTTVTYLQPDLTGRKDCDGKSIPQPKVVGWHKKVVPVSVTIECGFTAKELEAKGYHYGGSTSATIIPATPFHYWNGFWNLNFAGRLLSDLLQGLIWLILLVLALGLIYWLLRHLFFGENWYRNDPRYIRVSDATPPQGVVEPVAPILVPAYTPNGYFLPIKPVGEYRKITVEEGPVETEPTTPPVVRGGGH